MSRPNIIVHNATLKTLVAQSPVPMRLYLDRIVTAGPNLSKQEGQSVVMCDNVETFVTETATEIAEMIRRLDVNGSFFEATAIIKNGAEQKILIRRDAIISDFESNVDSCTVLTTLAGPIRILEKYIP